ncbi:MAG: hypothetical protein JW861_03660 [Bacteroidales bacterium]|nr:hypothetical protein [Bacteroidales bacterium]
MNQNSQTRMAGFAIVIIIAGLLLFLGKVGLLAGRAGDILISWQMLVIGIGVVSLIFNRSKGFGIILVCVGVFFLLPEFFEFQFRFGRIFLPVLLILLGVLILFRTSFRRRDDEEQIIKEQQEGTIDEVVVFSGSQKKIVTAHFRGGRVYSVFGGSEIDLRGSRLAEGANILDVFCIFGGFSMYVPEDWVIDNQVTAILGGFSDKQTGTPGPEAPAKKLVIKGLVIFGGGEIKTL